MENVIIYGAGGTGELLYNQFKDINEFNVLCFADGAASKHGTTKCGLPVISGEQIKDYSYDYIILAALTGVEAIAQYLTQELKIGKPKIIDKYVAYSYEARITFLKNQSQMIYEKKLQGNVAEAGVFQGEFAKYINKYFPDRKLYLFDTFEGFDERDTHTEALSAFYDYSKRHFDNTSVEMVKNRMLYKENCIFKKGYFPESARGVDDQFVFVNLDMDLYQPIKAGIEFFYPRMSRGGVILIHDFFSLAFKGVKQAVLELEKSMHFKFFPIGDGLSIAIYC
jgi:O-methyltransferase